MPGTGKYSGKEYRGHLRPSGKLTAQQFAEMTDARLREVWDALNDAYDFDCLEGTLMHNVDGTLVEMKRRGISGRARTAASRSKRSPGLRVSCPAGAAASPWPSRGWPDGRTANPDPPRRAARPPPDGRSLRLRGGSRGTVANGARVVLDASDTYILTLYKVRGTQVRKVAVEEGLYAEDLRGRFEALTGLVLTVPRFARKEAA